MNFKIIFSYHRFNCHLYCGPCTWYRDCLVLHQRNKSSEFFSLNFLQFQTSFSVFQRNPRYILPFLIVIAIYFAISLTCFFELNAYIIAFGVANVLFDGYAFICIYSLYAKLCDEEKLNNREGVNAQMNQPEAKV